jgi:A/G-specific adenine glycosylase
VQDVTPIIEWYRASRRVLPWREPGTTPWAVLVSEVMLQQTPVARVLPVFEEWRSRWPRARDLAAESPGEAVRAWGRLGYPRRALRLHAAATACVEHHGGEVPADPDALRLLPGVGEYTAAAVAAFAFERRVAVLDTNVRRVHARWLDGVRDPLRPSITVAERARAEALLPSEGSAAAEASVAVMELGALVCTARTPACGTCPVSADCGWFRAGRPGADAARPRGQSWHGTDRQCRGALLAVVREASSGVTAAALRVAWPEPDSQRERALHSLIVDGLIEPIDDGRRYALPRR